jgi:SulP family sulfate permease
MKTDRLRFFMGEISGSVADLGVMVPLVILLITRNGMNPTAVLTTAGLLYIASGLVFRVPVAVQPLKAVAIIAIAANLAPSVIAAAGILMGGILLLCSLTGAAKLLTRIFTRPIVRGIQLGVGILLVSNGVKMLLDPQLLRGGERVICHLPGADVPMGLLFGIAGGGILIFFSASRRVPAALLLLALGVVASLFFGSFSALQRLTIAPTPVTFMFPAPRDFVTAFLLLVLPQLPLTFGNSIVATTDTAQRYFSDRCAGVTPGRLSLSLGITNVLAGLVGAAPLCHGAGGMTAHYRFGARTGVMGVVIGSFLVAAGVLFGKSAPDLFVILPSSVLGTMLIYIGIEHAMLIRDIVAVRDEFFVALAIGTIAGATGNIFAATVTGFSLLLLLRLKEMSKGATLGKQLPLPAFLPKK